MTNRVAQYLNAFPSEDAANDFVKNNQTKFIDLWSYCVAGKWWVEGWYQFD